MDLILWRHAEAEPGEPDLQRRLTAKGIKQASKMAYWLDRNLPDNCRIFVSPAVRTLETVAALDRKHKIVQELAPDASAETVLRITNWPRSRETVMIVGHQPYLGQVAASVLGTPIQECAIRKGNIWWITQKQREDEILTYIKAIMTPDLVIK
jgi:phosphohistidine phosphatase